MFVFVSYPREYEVTAARLDAQLRDHGIDTFLDKEDIHDSEIWRVRIAECIKKADVYVVLYSLEAAKPERTFLNELNRIQTECKKDIDKKLITVIFPPTKPRDLPPYFSNRHSRIAEEKGEIDHESHSFWFDQIVQDIERFKDIRILEEKKKFQEEAEKKEAIDKIKNQNRQRQIIARVTLAGAAVTILALLYLNYYRKPDGEALCHSLIGTYRLHGKYAFTETSDTKSVATSAKWDAVGCEYDAKSHTFILKGREATDFDIQAIINNRYERIASATYEYTSSVMISQDGKFLGRSFETVLHPKDLRKVYKDSNGNNLNKPESYYQRKIDEVKEYRQQKHIIMQTTPCVPARGETGGRTMIAFACHGYTRVMVKGIEPF